MATPRMIAKEVMTTLSTKVITIPYNAVIQNITVVNTSNSNIALHIYRATASEFASNQNNIFDNKFIIRHNTIVNKDSQVVLENLRWVLNNGDILGFSGAVGLNIFIDGVQFD